MSLIFIRHEVRTVKYKNYESYYKAVKSTNQEIL